MNSTIPLARYPGASTFLVDYAAKPQRVMQWFDYDPHSDSALEDRLAELDEQGRLDVIRTVERGAWVAAVHAQQLRWGVGKAARHAAEHLGHPDTYVVVTGQQVGLFGGPLYALLKAATAVRLCRQLAERFPGKRFVPTFWMASSDSDFEEVRRTWILDQRGEPREISLPPASPDEEGLVVSGRDTGAATETALGVLAEALPGGSWRDEVLDALRTNYAAGGLMEGFARWMARLFAGTELVLLDPQDPVLMQCAKPLIRRELETAAETEQLLAERSNELESAGYVPQVEHLPGDTGLFLLDQHGRREKLARHGAGFLLRQSGTELSSTELLTIADVTPERFVAGVTLRPLYQNMLFPVAAFVGGGAEIAYRAQVTAVFSHHGQRMAPAYPRASATLLTDKLAGLSDELGLELTDCFVAPQDLAERVVTGSRPPQVGEALAGYRQAVGEADARLRAVAAELDPTLEQSFETLRGNLERHIEKLEKKITSSLKRQSDVVVGRAMRLHNLVYPLQMPQERALSAVSFLPRYGFGLVQQLIDRLTVPGWEHQLITLE